MHITQYHFALLLVVLLSACASKKTPPPAEVKDTHGCLTENGYVWDDLMQKCRPAFLCELIDNDKNNPDLPPCAPKDKSPVKPTAPNKEDAPAP
ncbi:MAG: hypothetical protein IT497_08860 [Ottowia sp.]|nr:hypothetical protein [Ottowia sp.]